MKKIFIVLVVMFGALFSRAGVNGELNGYPPGYDAFPSGGTYVNSDGLYYVMDHYQHKGSLIAPPEGQPPYSGDIVIKNKVSFYPYNFKTQEYANLTEFTINRIRGLENSDVESVTINCEVIDNNMIYFTGCTKLKAIYISPKTNRFSFFTNSLNGCPLTELTLGQQTLFEKKSLAQCDLEYADFSRGQVNLNGYWLAESNLKTLILRSDAELNSYAFKNAPKLKRLVFKGSEQPEKAEGFTCQGCFEFSPELVEIECEWSQPPAMHPTLGFDPVNHPDIYNFTGRCTLRVPSELVEVYRNAPGWSCFKNIEAIAGVDGIVAEPTLVSTTYYDILGREIENPASGSIVIEKSVYSNNKVKTVRRIVR